MRVLYVTSWAYGSGISVASAWPAIRTLCAFPEVDSVTYVTIDANVVASSQSAREISPKVTHVAISEQRFPYPLSLMRRHFSYLCEVKRSRYDLIVCRGASAIPYALAAQENSKAKLIVESFEPHSSYMVEAGQWRRAGLRARLQAKWEKAALDQADRIVTVSRSYADYLVEKGVPKERLRTVPCSADPNVFRPDDIARKKMRTVLGVNGTTCVYAGKFGGLYLTAEEACQVFSALKKVQFPDELEVLIITPASVKNVRRTIAASGLAASLTILSAAPDEVPGYLNAADFAISFHRSTESSFAYSPIKHAEYWATGLPVLCPTGIGDDAQKIPGTILGAVADMGSQDDIRSAGKRINEILAQPDHRTRIRGVWQTEANEIDLPGIYASLIASSGNACQDG